MLSPIQREHLDLIRNTAHGILRPREVLADARNPNSPLHGLFLWNDSEAAEAYRLQQAKQVIKVAVRFVPRASVAPQRVVISERPSQPMPRQTTQAPGGNHVHKGIDKEFREAIGDLTATYGEYSQLAGVLAEINAAVAKWSRMAPKPPPHFPGADRPGNGALSRFKPYTHGDAHADKERAALPATNAALTEQRTLFPSRVFNPDGADHVLISGHNNAKIGAFVTKGPWAGMDIYTLTMEERATCPTECHLWAECYGNAMPLAKRWEYGPKLIDALDAEIEEKSREHPAGFVVRLHVLGDFPDLDYVEQWRAWLKAYPQVHVFGYTAHPRFGLVGQALADMNRDFPNRWAIRFSVAPETPEQPMQATAIWRKAWGRVDEGIVCPASSGDTEACGTCGLCWHPAAADKRIVFLGHGMNRTQGGRPPGAQAGPDSKEITPKADIGNPITEQNQQVVGRDHPTDKVPVHKVEGITPSKGVAQTDTPPPPSGGGGVIAGGLKVSRPFQRPKPRTFQMGVSSREEIEAFMREKGVVKIPAGMSAIVTDASPAPPANEPDGTAYTAMWTRDRVDLLRRIWPTVKPLAELLGDMNAMPGMKIASAASIRLYAMGTLMMSPRPGERLAEGGMPWDVVNA